MRIREMWNRWWDRRLSADHPLYRERQTMSEATPDESQCPMHGEREPHPWDHSPKEPGCTCPTTTDDDAVRAEVEHVAQAWYGKTPAEWAAMPESLRKVFVDHYVIPFTSIAAYVAEVRAHERARIAAQRDKVAEAVYDFEVYVPGVTPPWERLPEPTRDHYRAMADAALATLGVSDR